MRPGRFFWKLLLLLVLIAACDRATGALLKGGLDRYFGLDRAADVLLVGHSHTMLGVDAVALERSIGRPVAKYAVNGANVFDRAAMVRHYLSTHPGVRVVVYDVDGQTFTGEGLSSNSYRLFYPYIDDPGMGAYLRAHAGSWQEYAARRLLTSMRFNATDLNLALRGVMGVSESFKNGEVDVAELRRRLAAGRRPPLAVNPDYLRAFDETVRLVTSRGAVLVLCHIPTVDLQWQGDPAGYARVIGIFQGYAARDRGVRFLNLEPAYGHRYDLFCDPVHLNRAGQKLVTADIARSLQNCLVTDSGL